MVQQKKEFIRNCVFTKSIYVVTLSTSFNLTAAFEATVLHGYWSLIDKLGFSLKHLASLPIETFQLHFVKSVRIWSYSGPFFPAFGLNTDQNNSGHFLRSVNITFHMTIHKPFKEIFYRTV